MFAVDDPEQLQTIEIYPDFKRSSGYRIDGKWLSNAIFFLHDVKQIM
jgi:hypothetical protein